MKKLVVDSSVCLKWVFEEEDSETARSLLEAYENGSCLLITPGLWDYEIVNALRTAVWRGKIAASQSRLFLKLLFQAKPEIISITDMMTQCLENAQRYEISGYDSAYVTLAREQKIVLISADDKLVTKVNDKKIVIPLKSYKRSN